MKKQFKRGEIYQVWEPGMDEWIKMKYVGFNRLTDDYIFVSPSDNEVWMFVSESDVEEEVK